MRARRIDANQPELVEFLKMSGASVYVISEPVDLLVGYRGKTCAVEVKNSAKPPSGRALTKQQEAFFQEFRGMAAKIETFDDCRELLRWMAE